MEFSGLAFIIMLLWEFMQFELLWSFTRDTHYNKNFFKYNIHKILLNFIFPTSK